MSLLYERILEVSRKIEKNIETIVESDLKDDVLIALYVFKKFKIKPGKKELTTLEDSGYIKNGKLTKSGEDILKSPEVVKKLKDIKS